MESLYQNCVSQFDIDLLDHATSDTQAASLALPNNPVARKQSLRFLKVRWKQVSDLVKRGKEANRVLEEVQKQLFDKNEECKELCNERNALFNQSSETSKNIQALKLENKLIKGKYHDAKNSLAATDIHSMQFKELSDEYEKVQDDIKKIERNRAKEKKARELAETRLKRILSEYIDPKKKKGNKWLVNLFRIYGIENRGKINNNDSSGDSSADEMFDDVPVPMSPSVADQDLDEDKISKSSILNGDAEPKNVDANVELTTIKNTNADFESVESVDTGRGSSLAFSDGEKSFHSPDYFPNDSPFSTAPNLCNKCHISKSDVCTSPIPEEMLTVIATTTSAEFKIDACTSPIKTLELVISPKKRESSSELVPNKCIKKVADIDSPDIIEGYEYDSPVENDTYSSDEESASTRLLSSTTPSNVEHNVFYENSMEGSEIQTADKKYLTNSTKLLENKLPVFHDSIVEMKLNSEAQQNCRLSESDNEDVDNETTSVNTESVDIKKGRLKNLSLLKVNQIVDKSEQPKDDEVSVAELPTRPAKIIEDINPSLELNIYGHKDTEALNSNNNVCDVYIDSAIPNVIAPKEIANASSLASPSNNVNVLIVLEEESVDKTITTEHIKAEKASTLEQNKTGDSGDVQECLQLNNSKNIDNDNSTDEEIQMIIKKMTLMHPIITPLPQTPSKISKPAKETTQSKITSKNLDVGESRNVVVPTIDDFDEYLNSVRQDTRKAFGLFDRLPGFIEKVITTMCKDENNQDVLRCILGKSTRRCELENVELKNINSEAEIDIEQDINTQTDNINSVHEDINDVEPDINTETDNIDNVHEDINDIEPDINTQTDVIDSVHEPVVLIQSHTNDIRTTELKKINDTIVYENGECASEDDSPQRNKDRDGICDENRDDSDAAENYESGIINLYRIKRSKLSKLQRFKLNILPKCKIKQDLRRGVKKLRYKPKPIRTPAVKRKVTDADSSATLNDKHVYDKAVRVLAESKAKYALRQEARVLVEDCAINILNNRHGDIINISPKSVRHIKRDLMKVFDNISQGSRVDKRDNRDSRSKSINSRRVLRSSVDKSEMVIDHAIERDNRKRKISNSQSCDDKSVINKRTDTTRLEEQVVLKKRRRRIYSSESVNEDVDVCENNRNVALINTRSGIGSRESSNRKADEKLVETNNTEVVPHKSNLIGDNNAAASPYQRILRSANIKKPEMPGDNNTKVSKKPNVSENNDKDTHINYEDSKKRRLSTSHPVQKEKNAKQDSNKDTSENSGKNILCTMIERYAVNKGFFPKKIAESIINNKCDKLEKALDSINDIQSNCTEAMNKLVADIMNWNVKHFLAAFTKYLKDPQRKLELFKKTIAPPAPTMTKKEQVWIYVIEQLEKSNWCPNIVEKILDIIEYTLFTLNKTPDMDVIESMAHFYALLCRYYLKQSRLRLFVIDAMYCLSFKSIPLVLQCLEVWMFILPLGHMGLAKTPLVACLVYLLHFYKCGRDTASPVQEMRKILSRKYYYDFSEWNETKVLDMVRASILDLRDCELEKKMMRMALIILAKRSGPKWCQTNIIKNLLQPIIENDAASNVAKRFSIMALGPLVKPYPADMKSYSEVIAHYLMRKLDQNNSPKMQEAIISSLLYMNKHNGRINEFLFKWCPNKMSPELENILKDYVRSKSVKAWKYIYSDSIAV